MVKVSKVRSTSSQVQELVSILKNSKGCRSLEIRALRALNLIAYRHSTSRLLHEFAPYFDVYSLKTFLEDWDAHHVDSTGLYAINILCKLDLVVPLHLDFKFLTDLAEIFCSSVDVFCDTPRTFSDYQICHLTRNLQIILFLMAKHFQFESGKRDMIELNLTGLSKSMELLEKFSRISSQHLLILEELLVTLICYLCRVLKHYPYFNCFNENGGPALLIRLLERSSKKDCKYLPLFIHLGILDILLILVDKGCAETLLKARTIDAILSFSDLHLDTLIKQSNSFQKVQVVEVCVVLLSKLESMVDKAWKSIVCKDGVPILQNLMRSAEPSRTVVKMLLTTLQRKMAKDQEDVQGALESMGRFHLSSVDSRDEFRNLVEEKRSCWLDNSLPSCNSIDDSGADVVYVSDSSSEECDADVSCGAEETNAMDSVSIPMISSPIRRPPFKFNHHLFLTYVDKYLETESWFDEFSREFPHLAEKVFHPSILSSDVGFIQSIVRLKCFWELYKILRRIFHN